MNHRRRISMFWLATLLAPPVAWPQTAASPVPHPLTGQIWDTRTRRPATMTEIERRLQDTRYVLLGEVHDNSVHHRMRGDLLASMLRNGRRPAIAMEQFDREQQAALDQAVKESPADAERVRVAGRFNEQGWIWPDYAPIVKLALESGVPLMAANLSRTDAFRVSTSGYAQVLGEQNIAALGLNQPLPAVAQRKLERIIEDGHCGKAPREILPGIVAAQRARDAVMAQALEQRATDGAVLIAGNGHVRRDFGVPHYLLARNAPDTILTVGFIEVDTEKINPAAYHDPENPEYDYIVFTARVAREDPCANLTFKPRQPMAQP